MGDWRREKLTVFLRWFVLAVLFFGLVVFFKQNSISTGGIARLGMASAVGGVLLSLFIGRFTKKEFALLSLIYDFTVITLLLKLTGGPFTSVQGGPSVNLLLLLYPLSLAASSARLCLLGALTAGVLPALICTVLMYVKPSSPSWGLLAVVLAVNLSVSAGASLAFGDDSKAEPEKVVEFTDKKTPLEVAEKQREDSDEDEEILSGGQPAIMELVDLQVDMVPDYVRTGQYKKDREDFTDTLSGDEDGPDALKESPDGEALEEMKTRLEKVTREKEDIEQAYLKMTRDSEGQRKREQQLLDKLHFLSGLLDLSGKMGAAFEFSDLLESIIQNVRNELNSPIVFIMLEKDGMLEVEASAGISEMSKVEYSCRVTADGSLISKLMVNGESVRLNRKDGADFGVFDQGVEQFETVLMVPLNNLQDNRPMGILTVANQQFYAPYSAEQESFLKIFASQAATFIYQFRLTKELENTYSELLTALSQAIESRDPFTRGHVHRTADFSQRLARAMKLPHAEIKRIQQAAILHDIGKIAIPEELLNKPTALTYEEYSAVKRHSQEGYKLLSRNELNIEERIKEYVLYHHERWDGQGYPKGLKEDQIPLGAQIIAVANTFDAMISDRPYRKGMSKEEALRLMKLEAGKQFNPKVLHTFFEMLDFDKNTEKVRPLTTESIEIDHQKMAKMRSALKEISKDRSEKRENRRRPV